MNLLRNLLSGVLRSHKTSALCSFFPAPDLTAVYSVAASYTCYIFLRATMCLFISLNQEDQEKFPLTPASFLSPSESVTWCVFRASIFLGFCCCQKFFLFLAAQFWVASSVLLLSGWPTWGQWGLVDGPPSVQPTGGSFAGGSSPQPLHTLQVRTSGGLSMQ